jgi:hypothetical protein
MFAFGNKILVPKVCEYESGQFHTFRHHAVDKSFSMIFSKFRITQGILFFLFKGPLFCAYNYDDEKDFR